MTKEEALAEMEQIDAEERALQAACFGTGKAKDHLRIFAIWKRRLELVKELAALETAKR